MANEPNPDRRCPVCAEGVFCNVAPDVWTCVDCGHYEEPTSCPNCLGYGGHGDVLWIYPKDHNTRWICMECGHEW